MTGQTETEIIGVLCVVLGVAIALSVIVIEVLLR